MKQIWPNYSYSPTTNVLTLTGLNIDRDQLLLVSAPERGRIMYNFADSTVTASAFTAGANTGLTLVASTAGLTTTASLVIYYDDQLASSTVTVSSIPAISGTVTVGALPALTTNTDFSIVGEGIAQGINAYGTIAIAADWENANQGIGNLNVTATCVTSTNRIGVVTIGGGTVTIGAGTLQIGSVTASISNSVTIASLPAISGTVTANTFAVQGTAVTTSNFTSTTASTALANYNATRQVLTIFNEGAGNLHIAPGATCTTIAYQVRLSSGDYYEAPSHQTTITHSAVFATAGTARIVQIS